MFGVVHRLGKRGAHRSEVGDGAAVVGGLPPTLSEQSGRGSVGVDQCNEGSAQRGQFVRKRCVFPGQGIYKHSGEGTPLGCGVAFALGEGKVEEGSLPAPEVLGGRSEVICSGAYRAASQVAAAGWVDRGAHGEVEVVDPGGDVDGGGEAGEVPCHGQDQGVERAPCGFLPELACGEAKNVASDGDAGHILVTTPKASVGSATDDETVDPGDSAVAVGDGSFAWPESPAAAGEDGEVVGVLEVRAPCEIARLQRRGEVRRGGVSYTPIRVHGVSEPGVCDEPVKRGRALGHGAAWLEKDRLPIVPLDVFKDALG